MEQSKQMIEQTISLLQQTELRLSNGIEQRIRQLRCCGLDFQQVQNMALEIAILARRKDSIEIALRDFSNLVSCENQIKGNSEVKPSVKDCLLNYPHFEDKTGEE